MRKIGLTVSMLTAESCWILAIGAVLARLVGAQAPILGVAATVATVSIGYAVARFSNDCSTSVARAVQILAALPLMYLGVVTSPALSATHSLSANLVWPITWASGEYGGQAIGAIVLACIGLGLAWRRGTAHGQEGFDQGRVMFLFKLGITAMSINTLAELGCECELGALPIGLVFLLAALAALALERIAPSTQMDVGWTATLMRTLATIFAFAAVAGFLAAQFGGGALSGLGVLWRTLVNWLVSALMFVLGPLLRALFGFIAWLRERLGNNDRDLSDGPFGKLEPFSWSKLPPVERWGESALGFIELALVALFFLILLRIVFSMKRPKANGLWQSQIIERESLRGARESRLAFLKGFLRDLLPDWLVATPSSTSAGMTADRSGPIGLYFDMLRLGIERGHELNRTATPSERIGPLSQALDTAPVREITEDFNHALYGEQPDQGARSEALRKDLLQSSARPDTE